MHRNRIKFDISSIKIYVLYFLFILLLFHYSFVNNYFNSKQVSIIIFYNT
jgi:hypothetical protein